MQRPPRPISDYMTPMPFTIEGEESLVKARGLMREFNIRHLPVKTEFRITGIISLHDIEFFAAHVPDSFAGKCVQDVPLKKAYVVTPDTALEKVSAHMAKERLDAALIMEENGSLLGIFTGIDALRALAHLPTAL